MWLIILSVISSWHIPNMQYEVNLMYLPSENIKNQILQKIAYKQVDVEMDPPIFIMQSIQIEKMGEIQGLSKL